MNPVITLIVAGLVLLVATPALHYGLGVGWAWSLAPTYLALVIIAALATLFWLLSRTTM